ncbi:5-hydroxytryptamine receptor-like [Anopheles bellator]|uniref:5-hydroxytryptamine receptor-like n=1 Tax=Anopheles bellator TaxID=139047 RepID=UPI0026483F2F|nr:5-hydroxytryptamine receptor-like [Anopheles bellator]
MALMDGGRPTNESFAWTALLPRSRGTASPASRVTYEFPPATTPSSGPPVTSYSALPSTTATWSTGTTGPPSTLGNASYAETYTSSGAAATTGDVVVDQLSLAAHDVPSAPFPGDRSPLATLAPSVDAVTATVQNLTRTLLGNYSSALDEDYGEDGGSSNSTLGASSLMPRGVALSLPDLLEEDELMALLNCTNCFLLNYGAAGGANNTTGRYYPNGTSLSPSDDEDAIASETTIYLIRVIATAVVLGIVILATVIGNVFVIAAILLERNLQSVANHLILSLAVADLLVACLVMPLGAVYEVSKEWRLGADLCDMWTSSDVLCCTASILHLVAIALDRYWAVTDIDYAHQRTARRIGYMIIIIWTLSVLVSIAPLLGWKDPEWEARVYQDLQCIVSQDVGYQIFATASSFYVPLLVILFLYWRIFLAARKRIRRRQQVNATQTASGGGMIANVAGGSGGIAAAVVAVIGRPLPTISETTTAFTNVSSANTSPEKGSLGNGIERDRIEIDPPTADISMAYPSGTQASCSSSARPPGSLASKKKAQSSTDSKRERKAAKTLAIITGAFVCCWLPFFIIAILLPTCTSCDISPFVTSVCLWLGYFNSTLNPIIYTIFSPEFRHAFKRILCGRRYSLRRTRNMGVRHMR